MPSLPSRPIFRVVSLVLVLALVGTACSSSGASQPKGADLASLTCKADTKAGLGAGEICVDTGIRNQSLFSFANWGGRRYKADDFGFPEMIALYGESVICAKVGQSECDVTPKARLMRTVIDNMLQNGRCEGLSALGALYMNSRGPALTTFKAKDIQSLTPATDTFANVIDYWWATQLLNEVIDQSKTSRKNGVKSVLEQIVAGLTEKRGVTVGIYSEEGAHSVLPVAVSRTDANTYIAHVWDSNNPRALGRLEFDLSANTWTYLGGRLNSGSSAKRWTGGDGSIDVVALDSRKGKPLLDVADSERGNATVTATSSSARALTVGIKTTDGKELIASAAGTEGAIPGVSVSPLKNGDTSQIVITIPNSIADYTVNLSSSGVVTKDPSGSTQLTIDGGSSRAISMSIPAKDGTSSASISTSIAKGGLQTFTATSPQNAVIQASTESSVVNVPVASRESLVLSDSASSTVDSVVALKPAGGTSKTVTIETPKSGTTQDVVVARTTDGSIVAVVNPLAAVAINREKLNALTGLTSDLDSDKATAQAAETPSAVSNITARNFAGAVSDTTAVVTSRISSESDTEAWVEYGSVENWTQVGRTTKQAVGNGVETEIKSNLGGLTPGTTYRIRTAIDLDGFVVYSDYATFETTGVAPDDAATQVSDANVKVSSSLVAATATGGVVSSKISTPIASKAWIEYSLESNPSLVLKTTEQSVAKGTGSILVTVLNGLSMGQSYRYRVVVKARDAFGYSQLLQITTGTTIATERLATTAIGSTYTFTVTDITTASATVNAVVSSSSKGRLQVEVANQNGGQLSRTKAVAFAAGKNVKISVPLTGLSANKTYQVRILVNVGNVTQYSAYRIIETAAEISEDTSSGRLTDLKIPSSSLTETSASFSVAVKSDTDANVYFEYSVDNSSVALLRSRSTNVTYETRAVGPIETDVRLRAGTPYRVRAVIVVNGKDYHTAFVNFTTPGALDPLSYKATTPTLRRTANGADVSWSMPTADIPSAITYKVLEGSTVLCSTKALVFDCEITISSYGTHSIVVASYFNGTEITRSTAGSITISGTPTITSFSFVSATSSALVFTYSFNPQGETVQYGIQITGIAPSLGGTTSTAVNGATQQVTGLSASTSYQARLVLINGSVITGSDWITVSTS